MACECKTHCCDCYAEPKCRACTQATTTNPPVILDELVERAKRALADQQERFPDEPVMLRPDDLRGLLERDERMLRPPGAAVIAAGMDAWERTAGTREDMLRNAYVAMVSEVMGVKLSALTAKGD